MAQPIPNFGPFWDLGAKISYHIANILKEKEIDANSVIKDYLITASCAELIVAAVMSSRWGVVI